MASASMVISTRSPTTIPPRSSGAFQLTPKSRRFIVVVAMKPARVLGALIDAILPPRRLPLTQIASPKFAGAAYAANGQISLDRVIVIAEQFHFAAAKPDAGMMLNVEEISPAQVCVAIWLARPQCAGVDLEFNRGGLWPCGIEVEPAMDVFEVPANVGDHHVAYSEFRGCMSEEPLRQGSFLSFGS